MDFGRNPRIADDNDFASLRDAINDHKGWALEIDKDNIQVWTRPVSGCNFNMVKILSHFTECTPDILFDVLHDPDYRREWDSHMLESEEIGVINVNNDVGYYAMSCPPPLKPRDFVLMRSWLDTGPQGEQMLLSRSVPHKNYPPRKGYVRATSYITGFVIRSAKTGGCFLGYIAHCDPQGALPPWLVNKVTHTVGPRMVKDLRKAAVGYVTWKNSQSNMRKPWRFPEEMTSPRISLDDCVEPQTTPSAKSSSPSISSIGSLQEKNSKGSIKKKKNYFSKS
ncbi:START domain-containing protein 10-like isoform X2 [Hermetia illucens]|uniref:START domain-containing protein 10-like isoform X2 n=1 Tax=Hermetia illucens TaxID=343691 RepID=UPI0018CC34CB|nr:START domain-containing protein 10-like isoform X2 [Hermetia illucens]